jgi:hypothetical protein
MARRLDIVIFQVNKEDASDKIRELVDAHAGIGARHKCVSPETDLSVAHLSVSGVYIRRSDAEFITGLKEHGHLSPKITNAQGGGHDLSKTNLPILCDADNSAKGGANTHIEAEDINEV